MIRYHAAELDRIAQVIDDDLAAIFRSPFIKVSDHDVLMLRMFKDLIRFGWYQELVLQIHHPVIDLLF